MVKKDIIELDLQKIMDNNLDVEAFVTLCLINKKNFKMLERFSKYHILLDAQYEVRIMSLQSLGWIKVVGPDLYKDLEVRDKFLELLRTTPTEAYVKNIPLWIDEYRDMFGKCGSGFMGLPAACIAKMQRFFETYPVIVCTDKTTVEVTKKVVMEAAALYIQQQTVQRFKYLQRADYFIFKEEKVGKVETSRLYNYIEDIKRAERQPSNVTEI